MDWGLAFILLALGELFFRGWLWDKLGGALSLVLFLLVFLFGYQMLFAVEIPRLLFFLLVYGALMSFLRVREDGWTCALAAIAYFGIALGAKSEPYFQTIALQLFLLSVPLYFRMRWKGLAGALGDFGIKREGLLRNVLFGVLATFAIMLALIGVSLALYLLHYGNDLGGVREKIDSFPQFVVLMAFTLTPFAEEIFFRGLLFPILGALASSLVFAASHYQYGSIFEIGAAFFVAYFWCWLYKKTGSLIPSIVSHALFNLISLSLAGRVGLG